MAPFSVMLLGCLEKASIIYTTELLQLIHLLCDAIQIGQDGLEGRLTPFLCNLAGLGRVLSLPIFFRCNVYQRFQL